MGRKTHRHTRALTIRAIHSCGAVADLEPRFPNIPMRYKAELERLRHKYNRKILSFRVADQLHRMAASRLRNQTHSHLY